MSFFAHNTSPFYTIFNISHLKIVSGSEMESRQSNKESAIQRGGNEEGSSLLSVMSFLLFLSSLAAKNLKSKHLLVHKPFSFACSFLFFCFFFQPPLSGCQISLPTSTAHLATPREFSSQTGSASSSSDCFSQWCRSFEVRGGNDLIIPNALPGSLFTPRPPLPRTNFWLVSQWSSSSFTAYHRGAIHNIEGKEYEMKIYMMGSSPSDAEHCYRSMHRMRERAHKCTQRWEICVRRYSHGGDKGRRVGIVIRWQSLREFKQQWF